MAKKNSLTGNAASRKNELINAVRLLSANSLHDYFQMIQPHNHDGSPKGSLKVNAFRIFLEMNLPHKWNPDEVRSLWMQSVEFIPGATVDEANADAGFTTWLWSQTQRLWTARDEQGYAINPYMMWLSALVTGCAGEQVVSSNPRRATAIEVSLIAEHASRIAADGEKCEENATRCRQSVSDELNPLDAGKSPPECSGVQRAGYITTITPLDGRMFKMQEYRRAEIKRVRLQWMGDVVAGFELVLLPGTFAKRPTHWSFSAESMAHMQLVAIELENHANSMATNVPAGPEWAVDSKQKWRHKFGWSETTFRKRRRDNPAAFRDGTNLRLCEIDPAYVEKWASEKGK